VASRLGRPVGALGILAAVRTAERTGGKPRHRSFWRGQATRVSERPTDHWRWNGMPVTVSMGRLRSWVYQFYPKKDDEFVILMATGDNVRKETS